MSETTHEVNRHIEAAAVKHSEREWDAALARAERAEAALVARHGGEPVALLAELDAARAQRDAALARAETAEKELAAARRIYGACETELRAQAADVVAQRDALRTALDDLFACLALIGGSKELVALLGDEACSALDRLAALAQAKGGVGR